MNEKATVAGAPRRMRLKVIGGVAAVGATAVLVIMAVQSVGQTGSTGVPLAGSGDAPANTTYIQPVVPAMTMGGTEVAVTTTTGAAPLTAKTR